MNNVQPPAKWTIRDLEQKANFMGINKKYFVFVKKDDDNCLIPQDLLEQLQSEAKKEQYLEDFIEFQKIRIEKEREARADERKKIKTYCQSGSSQAFETIKKGMGIANYFAGKHCAYNDVVEFIENELEQPVESSTNETKERK